MAIANACFISYRHSADPTARRTVEAFRDGLATQLALYNPNARIFFDEKRLQAGCMFNTLLARELCQSSCMILLFNPYYFDLRHPYCALEYRTMQQLEAARLAALRNKLPYDSLIIPVVLRGDYALPDEVKQNRWAESFDQDLLGPGDFQKASFKKKLRGIAEVVERVHRVMQHQIVGAEADCDGFRFPKSDDILPWLDELVAGIPDLGFPGR